MKFIFDVDRTLFDTKRFSLEAEPYKENGVWVTPQIWDILDARDYVFEDVVDYLTKVGKDNIELLTAMSLDLGPEAEEFQKKKLERSGLMAMAEKTTFMVGLKGEYVREIASGGPAVFIDDRTDQLESVSELSPNILPILMDRERNYSARGFEGVEKIPEFKIATNLTDVERIVESWKEG